MADGSTIVPSTLRNQLRLDAGSLIAKACAKFLIRFQQSTQMFLRDVAIEVIPRLKTGPLKQFNK
jgi:hypothetical protein